MAKRGKLVKPQRTLFIGVELTSGIVNIIGARLDEIDDSRPLVRIAWVDAQATPQSLHRFEPGASRREQDDIVYRPNVDSFRDAMTGQQAL